MDFKSIVKAGSGVSCRLLLVTLIVLILAVSFVYFATAFVHKPRVYQPQQVAVESCTCSLMGNIEKALSASPDSPIKDKYIEI